MSKIKNPILRGFNPDPSIIRVKDDYYIATSTFEWFPGVQIHHSRNLINWKLIKRPLDRISQLNMIGCPNSAGIWAPCLSYSDGTFFLIYTNQKSDKSSCMDANNYIVTTDDILGDWSEPIYIHSMGFDPSIFHDDNGKKWIIWAMWDHRQRHDWFGGIFIQEYNHTLKKLVGEPVKIFDGSDLGATEGPHLYKRNGYYYLMTAEGGTSYTHAVTLARSKNIYGPYTVHPENPILTSSGNEDLEIQKAGHGSLVETQNNRWYIAHLCGRPLTKMGACVLGRETSNQKMEWRDDDWLYTVNKKGNPDVEVNSPGFLEDKKRETNIKDDFDREKLDINFQSLRIPLDETMMSLKERPGYLRLYGRESVFSKFKHSFIARRQQSFIIEASTKIEYEPHYIQQRAGLVCWYNSNNFYYLRITSDEEKNKTLGISYCVNKGKWLEPIEKEIILPRNKPVFLKASINYDKLQFYYSLDNFSWIEIGDVYDASTLSDEKVEGWSFTGNFIGLSCQDLTGKGLHADFDYFEYIEKD